jgi:hypothetical protein
VSTWLVHPNPSTGQDVEADWRASFSHRVAEEYSLVYRCPKCSRASQLSIGVSESESRVSTQLYCHSDGNALDVPVLVTWEGSTKYRWKPVAAGPGFARSHGDCTPREQCSLDQWQCRRALTAEIQVRVLGGQQGSVESWKCSGRLWSIRHPSVLEPGTARLARPRSGCLPGRLGGVLFREGSGTPPHSAAGPDYPAARQAEPWHEEPQPNTCGLGFLISPWTNGSVTAPWTRGSWFESRWRGGRAVTLSSLRSLRWREGPCGWTVLLLSQLRALRSITSL